MLLNCGLEKTLESPLDGKEIKTVNPKGNQPRVFTGELTLKLKLQYFGLLIQTTDWLEKTLMLGKIEGGRRRTIEDDMVGWHHWLDGQEFEQALGAYDAQGSLACCSAWVTKSWTQLSDWTENLGTALWKLLRTRIGKKDYFRSRFITTPHHAQIWLCIPAFTSFSPTPSNKLKYNIYF